MEDTAEALKTAKQLMEKAFAHTQVELARIRAGKASPNMLDGIEVEYYGTPTPLNQLATVNTPDAKSILIKPYDKTALADIERAISKSELGLTPQNDGEQIRLNIPALTEERRKEIVKQAKSTVEDGKVSIRNARKETNDGLKKLQKDGFPEDDVKRTEDEVQKLTDSYNKKMDELYEHKEKDIMTI